MLTELGLTSSEATVYLNLSKLKDPEAKALYKITDIARQDVYQVLSELQELGLVERILTKPLRFRATPIANAIAILNRRQVSKNSELHNKALKLFSCSEQWERTQESDFHEPFFELRNIYLDDPRVKDAIRNAKVKIRLLDKNMNWPVFHSYINEWTYTLNKGVKIEVLNEFVTNRQTEPKFIEALMKEDFQIKYSKSLPSGALLLFDDKELAIWEGSKPKHVSKSASKKALWSNHHGLIQIASTYFELYWKTASPLEKPACF